MEKQHEAMPQPSPDEREQNQKKNKVKKPWGIAVMTSIVSGTISWITLVRLADWEWMNDTRMIVISSIVAFLALVFVLAKMHKKVHNKMLLQVSTAVAVVLMAMLMIPSSIAGFAQLTGVIALEGISILGIIAALLAIKPREALVDGGHGGVIVLIEILLVGIVAGLVLLIGGGFFGVMLGMAVVGVAAAVEAGDTSTGLEVMQLLGLIISSLLPILIFMGLHDPTKKLAEQVYRKSSNIGLAIISIAGSIVVSISLYATLVVIISKGMDGIIGTGYSIPMLLIALTTLVLLAPIMLHVQKRYPKLKEVFKYTFPTVAVSVLFFAIMTLIGLQERISEYGMTQNRLTIIVISIIGILAALLYCVRAVQLIKKHKTAEYCTKRTTLVVIMVLTLAAFVLSFINMEKTFIRNHIQTVIENDSIAVNLDKDYIDNLGVEAIEILEEEYKKTDRLDKKFLILQTLQAWEIGNIGFDIGTDSLSLDLITEDNKEFETKAKEAIDRLLEEEQQKELTRWYKGNDKGCDSTIEKWINQGLIKHNTERDGEKDEAIKAMCINGLYLTGYGYDDDYDYDYDSDYSYDYDDSDDYEKRNEDMYDNDIWSEESSTFISKTLGIKVSYPEDRTVVEDGNSLTFANEHLGDEGYIVQKFDNGRSAIEGIKEELAAKAGAGTSEITYEAWEDWNGREALRLKITLNYATTLEYDGSSYTPAPVAIDALFVLDTKEGGTEVGYLVSSNETVGWQEDFETFLKGFEIL